MSRWVAGAAVLGAAAVICYFMQVMMPHYADLTGPIPARGTMDDTVRTRQFDLHVDKIVLARELVADDFGGRRKRLTTGGIWAVVTVDIAARKNTTTVAAATWQGPTGLRYRRTERLLPAPDLPPLTVGPGFTRRGRLVFEIPPSQAADATLLVSNALFFALDSEARISLDGIRLTPEGVPEAVLPVYDLKQPI